MARCRHNRTHTESQGPVKIGGELVTYEDIVCDECDRVIARRIVNRQKVKD